MRRGPHRRRPMTDRPSWAGRGHCCGGAGGCGCRADAEIDLDVADEIEVLEEFQRDLEEAVADIAGRIKRLREAVDA